MPTSQRFPASAATSGCPSGRVRAGAFYAWVDVADRAPSARQFALELLRHQRVAVAPGTAFGPAGEGWVRLHLVAETDALLEGHATWRGSRSVDLVTAPAAAAGHSSGSDDLDVR
jgi:hypothetical protein